MGYILLRADAVGVTAADDVIVPAAQVPALRDADALLGEARRLRDEVATAVEAARAEGREAGRREGDAAGRAAGEEAARAEMFKLTMRAAEERTRVRGEVATLALEVVRRVAGEIGPATVVAGLAETAAHQLLPDTAATVRVAPAATAAVIGRLGAFPALTVLGDEALADGDCVIETPLGTTRAGLEIQLAAVKRAWESADAG